MNTSEKEAEREYLKESYQYNLEDPWTLIESYFEGQHLERLLINKL
jgi:hypothetical protein